MKWIRVKRKDVAGFTLFESLLALAINSLLLLLVGFMFQTLFSFHNQVKEYRNSEWHLFLNQVENSLPDLELTFRGRNELHFKEKDELITFKLTNGELRRTKNNAGYFPMLTKVRNVRFTDGLNGIHMQIDFSNGQTMRGYMPIEKQDESQ